MNVLVTGGTGFIGLHVVRALLKREHKVAVLARNRAKAQHMYRWDKVEVCEGDITDFDSMKRAMSGRECVINCVQFPNHPVENPSRAVSRQREGRNRAEASSGDSASCSRDSTMSRAAA